MKEIGIGLLGFGTVGAGVVKGLQENGELIAQRLGVRPVLRRIADLDLKTDRGVAVDPALLTTDAAAVIDAPDVDIVVELIGGTGIARKLVLQALSAGKPVVTANKHLLAEHGAEIFDLADRKQTDIYYGASVGGGIPIIRALREGLVGNRIDGICAILNGTCNYILTRMESNGMSFDAALAEAQQKGYAEADPGLDIDGFDTAHKAVLLASLAYGTVVPMDAVHVEGIRGLADMDMRYAANLGYRIKLLAVIKCSGDGAARKVEVRVHPTLIPADGMLASVHGVFNAVLVRGDFVGESLYYGRGAGQRPTASTVIADICDVARNLDRASVGRVPSLPRVAEPLELRPMAEVRSRHYLRLTVKDEPNVLADFARILGSHGISIASVLQVECSEGGYVPVVIVSHEAAEGEMLAAIAEIDRMAATGAKTVHLRIEE